MAPFFHCTPLYGYPDDASDVNGCCLNVVPRWVIGISGKYQKNPATFTLVSTNVIGDHEHIKISHQQNAAPRSSAHVAARATREPTRSGAFSVCNLSLYLSVQPQRRLSVVSLVLLNMQTLKAKDAECIPHRRLFSNSGLLFASHSDRSRAPAELHHHQQQHRHPRNELHTTHKKHSDWKQAVADFERLAASGAVSASPLEPSAVHEVVELCVKSDRPREALEVTKRAQQLGVEVSLGTHALVCSAMVKKGSVDRALEMMEELQRQHPSDFGTSVYDPLLSVLKTQSDWRSTHRVIQQMHELKLQPPLRAFRVLMLSAAKARKKDTLSATIAFVQRQFPNAKTDVATLTAICQALVAVDDTKRVLEIYNETDTKWLQDHANTILYNNFLLAAVKNDRHMDRAMAIFDQMKESVKGHPDDFTFATCMLEFERREDWTQVLSLYNDMQEREVKQSAGASFRKPVTNALTCAAVIRALHKLQDAEEGSTSSKHLRRDLNIVLKKLPFVDLSHIGHASNLVDTLDDCRLYTHARQVFARLLSAKTIHEESWMRKDGYEIDLHTFSYGVAKCAVVHAFEEIKRRHEHHIKTSNDKADDLRIITGIGKHSKEYLKPKIREEVAQMFSRSFRPPIWPATHPTNPGVLIVRSKVLRNWILKDGVVRYF